MSNTVHLNITLPVDLAAKVKKAPNQSALITQSLLEKFARDDQAELEATLAKSYQLSAEEDKEMLEDWDSTTGDGID